MKNCSFVIIPVLVALCACEPEMDLDPSDKTCKIDYLKSIKNEQQRRELGDKCFMGGDAIQKTKNPKNWLEYTQPDK